LRANLPFRLVIEPAIDLRYLFHPELAFAMLQPHDLFVGPMEVISNIGYLLKEPV
jgi:hypothetical protein